jgi:predicted CoA-binding protein
MDRLGTLRHLLIESSDHANPSAERVRRLFESIHRIAVVGLSRDPRKAARRVPSYLAAKGYEVIPVNPFADRILGREAVASLEEVDEPEEGIRADEEAAAARARGRVVVQDLCAYKVHRAIFS